jgi:predicted permease
MWFRRRANSDFQAEIEAHLRLEAERRIAEGTPKEQAQAAARRALGNAVIVQERFYESRRWLWWDQLRQDLRFGARSLRKTPAFTAAVALTIALGVGANTAVFSLVDAVLLQSLPLRNPGELFFPVAAGTAGETGAPPYPCLERLRDEAGSIAGMTAFTNHDELRIEIDGRPEAVVGQIVSGNYFQLLGVKPEIGRLLEPEDERLNPPVAVISDHHWRRRYGADPAVIGRAFSDGKVTFTIVGVMPPEFVGLKPGSRADIAMPITLARGLLTNREARVFHAIVRLKPGVSADRATAESNAVFQSFMSGSRIPPDQIRQQMQRLELEPAGAGFDTLRRRFSKPLWALMGIVGMVLLMATANITNLLLARGLARQREFAIRLAAGAGRVRLVRQLLTETLLLFALGALPGVIVARWGVSAVQGMFAEGRRAITVEANLNGRVLAFSILVTLAAGILSGMFPAWRAFRTSLEAAMREGHSRSSESRGSARLTGTLVGFQVALSLVLLVGAVTFVRTLASLRHIDPGFRNEQVLTMSVELPERPKQAVQSSEFWGRFLDTVRGIPGVRSAALSVLVPLSGRNRSEPVKVRGYQPTSSLDGIGMNPVSEGYFETVGIPLVRGRLLTARDTDGALRVAVINQAAARKYFGGRDPIGESLDFGGGASYQVCGVVGDTKHTNLRDAAPPFAFLPLRQAREPERRITLTIASAIPNGEMALVQPIRKVASFNPAMLVSEVITIRSQLDSTLLTERLLSGLSSAFGVLAMILAAIGLYGVLSYRIGQQRQSIGVRMALGASPASVRLAVLRQSAWVIGAGLACGLPFAILAVRMADSMLWDVRSSDPLVYLAAVVLLSLAGLVSAWIPARRASSIHPAEALRHS